MAEKRKSILTNSNSFLDAEYENAAINSLIPRNDSRSNHEDNNHVYDQYSVSNSEKKWSLHNSDSGLFRDNQHGLFDTYSFKDDDDYNLKNSKDDLECFDPSSAYNTHKANYITSNDYCFHSKRKQLPRPPLHPHYKDMNTYANNQQFFARQTRKDRFLSLDTRTPEKEDFSSDSQDNISDVDFTHSDKFFSDSNYDHSSSFLSMHRIEENENHHLLDPNPHSYPSFRARSDQIDTVSAGRRDIPPRRMHSTPSTHHYPHRRRLPSIKLLVNGKNRPPNSEVFFQASPDYYPPSSGNSQSENSQVSPDQFLHSEFDHQEEELFDDDVMSELEDRALYNLRRSSDSSFQPRLDPRRKKSSRSYASYTRSFSHFPSRFEKSEITEQNILDYNADGCRYFTPRVLEPNNPDQFFPETSLRSSDSSIDANNPPNRQFKSTNFMGERGNSLYSETYQ